MEISMLLSIMIITIAWFLTKKYKINTKYKFLITMGICLLCLAVLVYPLFDINDVIIKITTAIYFALKSITLNEEIDILANIGLNNLFGWIYFLWVNFFLIALPFFTVSTLMAFISDLFADLKIKKIKNKDLYIFSEMNEKSLTIANCYENIPNSAIIFTNVNDNNSKSIKSINLSERINDINFNDYNNKITLFMISKNEEQNLNDTLEIIDKYKNISMKVYVINNFEAPTILDSIDKGSLDIEIVNENERAIFSLIDSKPLYLNNINNTISILIVGCGSVGKEFLKDSIWCSVMPGYKYKALVIDLKADEIKDNIEVEMPDLLKYYDITFINADIKSKKAIDAINKQKDINYVLVSMDTERKNLDAALELRRNFIKQDRKPIINIWVQNDYKKEQIDRLTSDKKYSYDINAFGSIKDMYFDKRIVDSDIERLAKEIHLSHNKVIQDYYKNEINKRSSRARALHVKYKLYFILKDKYTNNLDEDLKRYREINTKEIEDMIAENEHERWNAYMRSIGYTWVSFNELKKYYPLTKSYKDHIGKRHPALIPFKELDKLSENLKELGIDTNLRAKDYDIVNMMLNRF